MLISLQLKKRTPGAHEEQGDIIGVYRTVNFVSVGPHFRWIHVIGFPVGDFPPLKRMLERRDYQPTGEFDVNGPEIYRLRNSRIWHVPRGSLPTVRRNELRTTGETTMTWANVRPLIRRKNRLINRDDSQNGNGYDPTASDPITDDEVNNPGEN